MHLSQFHDNMQRKLHKFFCYWVRMNMEEGDREWPTEMDDADWEEQFQIWLEMEGDDEL